MCWGPHAVTMWTQHYVMCACVSEWAQSTFAVCVFSGTGPTLNPRLVLWMCCCKTSQLWYHVQPWFTTSGLITSWASTLSKSSPLFPDHLVWNYQTKLPWAEFISQSFVWLSPWGTNRLQIRFRWEPTNPLSGITCYLHFTFETDHWLVRFDLNSSNYLWGHGRWGFKGVLHSKWHKHRHKKLQTPTSVFVIETSSEMS